MKLLWGRSGNRCAICKRELTPDGAPDTLGEMAHIVARSPDGPRGVSDLPLKERDCYDNHILLCPNHHSQVDKNPDEWPTERLRACKVAHEEWVSARLTASEIDIQPIDNSAFLAARRKAWSALAPGEVAVAVSLTPLRISMETLDPQNSLVVQQLQSARVPGHDRGGTQVNRSWTKPTANGVVNQDVRGDSICGHRIEIFRVGHCEYFLDLARGVRQITDHARKSNDDLDGARVVRYTDVAEAVELGVAWLWNVWAAILPFTYMTITASLINTTDTILYSREGSFSPPLFGRPDTNHEHVEYSEVTPKGSDVQEVALNILGRMANAYGLVLDRVYDEPGKFARPERMH